MSSNSSVISVKDLKHSYGKNDVLKGVNLSVEKGTMLALLGPNGAGKTTIVRILSTLLKPSNGGAKINNYDVIKNAEQVKSTIGLTGQSTAIDDLLTGRENLEMMGRLYRLSRQSTKDRAQELLEELDLVEASNRPAKTYSGGMRRRLDLAVSLIAKPPILFLDEPTTGLDPRSRLTMWDIIRGLMKDGTTILLTTQYLEEADQLADKIAVIDNGVVIAEGTAETLKKKVGKDRLELFFADRKTMISAESILTKEIIATDKSEHSITIAINDVNQDVKRVLEKLAKSKTKLSSMEIHKPTLDDVFLSVTGKKKADAEESEGKTNEVNRCSIVQEIVSWCFLVIPMK